MTERNIQEIKDAANIVDVVNHFASDLRLKNQGGNLVACCPFHNEKTGSFTINKRDNYFKCFGCGKSGDSISFVMEYKKYTFVETIKALAEYYNISLDDEPNQPKKQYIKPKPRPEGLSPEAIALFNSRGIELQTLREFNVTGCREYMPKSGENTDTICFNYYRDGELTNIKFRSVTQKDFRLSKDAELIFYNLDAIKNSDKIIIVEGEMDALSVYQVGYRFVVSVPNGANKGANLEYLNNCYQYFENAKKVVIFTDNDEPGRALQDELSRRIGRDKCWLAAHRHDCKDANEILTKYGKEALQLAIQNSTEYPIEGIISMSEMSDTIDDFYLHGYPDGFKSGIYPLDQQFRITLGQMTIVTGIPGHGKSEFIDFLMTKLSLNNNLICAVISFETNVPLHATKIIQKYIGRAFDFRKDPKHRITEQEKNAGKIFVDKHFVFMQPSKIDVTLDGILDKAKELVLRRGIKLLLIDPWNYIETKIPAGQTETNYISDCLTKLRNFVQRYDIHLFLIVHPTKMPKNGNKYEVPNMYSLSGSAHFFNKTDNGLCVYRNDDNTVDIHIQKIKNEWLGSKGTIVMHYNTMTRQYESTVIDDNKQLGNTSLYEEWENPRAGIDRNHEANKIEDDVPF